MAGEEERGIESQVVSEDKASTGEDDDSDVDEKSIEARDEEGRGDTSGEVDDEDESEDGDNENLELPVQPRVALPGSRRSTRLSVPPEKFIAGQANPKITKQNK